jgi:sulfatase maturation enzyme AslB (radical SAM superfamily)
MLRAVTLLLSHRCNLRCSYCYQTARQGTESMPWPTARRALDLLFDGRPGRRAVELSGGEPALEPALLRRCVEHVRSVQPGGATVDCTLTTNGTLLGDELVSFLADRDVKLELSFDGVPAAQNLRAEGSFGPLDRLLVSIRRRHPRYLSRRVTVNMMVHGATLPFLAASVRYLITRGVARIAVAPCILAHERWRVSDGEVLRHQVRAIVESSLRQLDSTGTIPVTFLAGADPMPRPKPGAPRCAAVSGASLCVDTAGKAWGCALFAGSLRRLPPLAASGSNVTFLGDVHDPAVVSRLASLPERARSHPLFSKTSPGCGAVRCRSCDVAGDCFICPAAICEEATRLEPHRVPELACAFNRIALEGRGGFLDALSRAGAGGCPAELAAALDSVTRALQSEPTPHPPSRTVRH